jgi:hypothetical protein
MPTQEIQTSPIAVDDLNPYRGSWVALRHGHVVASGLSPTELAARPEVEQDDSIVFVPTGTNHTLIL